MARASVLTMVGDGADVAPDGQGISPRSNTSSDGRALGAVEIVSSTPKRLKAGITGAVPDSTV
jgi:hypothetical protein